MTTLEKRFEQDMISIYTTAKKECGYNANRFLQMIGAKGGLATAKQLMKKAIRREFVNVKHLSEQIALIDKAIDLANEDVDDLEAIRELGQGWVAEETLAIAIYCALKYSNDFDKALIASVNHSGDSDSTGAVTGNILGAYLGLSGIPEKYLKNLELKNVILELADDLFNDCKITEYGSYHDEIWEQKYIYKSYRPKR